MEAPAMVSNGGPVSVRRAWPGLAGGSRRGKLQCNSEARNLEAGCRAARLLGVRARPRLPNRFEVGRGGLRASRARATNRGVTKPSLPQMTVAGVYHDCVAEVGPGSPLRRLLPVSRRSALMH